MTSNLAGRRVSSKHHLSGRTLRGIFRATNPNEAERALNDFLSEVTVLSINEEAARIFGQERARLRQVARPMSDLDLLIAATALRHDLTVLTADRDFERVEHLNTIFP